jgi:hypothetical protein
LKDPKAKSSINWLNMDVDIDKVLAIAQQLKTLKELNCQLIQDNKGLSEELQRFKHNCHCDANAGQLSASNRAESKQALEPLITETHPSRQDSDNQQPLAQAIVSASGDLSSQPSNNNNNNNNNNNTNDAAMKEDEHKGILFDLNISAIPIEEPQAASFQTQPLLLDISHSSLNANQPHNTAEDLFSELERQQQSHNNNLYADENSNANKAQKFSERKRRADFSPSATLEQEKKARLDTIQAMDVAIEESSVLRLSADSSYQRDNFSAAASEYEKALSIIQNLTQSINFHFKQLNADQNNETQLPKQAKALADLYANVLSGLVRSLCKLKRFAECDEFLKELFSVAPAWYKTYSLAATVNFYEKNFTGAEKHYRKALSFDLTPSERSKISSRLEVTMQRIAHQQEKQHQGQKQGQFHIHSDSDMPAMNSPARQGQMQRAAGPFHPVSPLPKSTQRAPLRPINSPTPLSSGKTGGHKDYSLIESYLPRITKAGIKDLLGGDHFVSALKLYEEKAIYKVRAELRDNKICVLHAKCWRQSEKKRHKLLLHHDDSEMFESSVEISGNRISSYQCSCEEEILQHTLPARQGSETDAQQLDQEAQHQEMKRKMAPKVTKEGNIVPGYSACEHAGLILLWLLKKQEEYPAVSNQTENQPNINSNMRGNAAEKKSALFISASRVQSTDELRREQELFRHFDGMTVGKLQQLLELNQQKKSGLKAQLVQRCVESAIYGCPSRCEKCGGKLSYAGGVYRCNGIFDEFYHRATYCDFVAETVVKKVWTENSAL